MKKKENETWKMYGRDELQERADQISAADRAEDFNRGYNDEGCPGHPAGPNDPMGETVYCDGSCQS